MSRQVRKQIVAGRKSRENCEISLATINSRDIFSATFPSFKVSEHKYGLPGADRPFI